MLSGDMNKGLPQVRSGISHLPPGFSVVASPENLATKHGGSIDINNHGTSRTTLRWTNIAGWKITISFNIFNRRYIDSIQSPCSSQPMVAVWKPPKIITELCGPFFTEVQAARVSNKSSNENRKGTHWGLGSETPKKKKTASLQFYVFFATEKLLDPSWWDVIVSKQPPSVQQNMHGLIEASFSRQHFQYHSGLKIQYRSLLCANGYSGQILNTVYNS